MMSPPDHPNRDDMVFQEAMKRQRQLDTEQFIAPDELELTPFERSASNRKYRIQLFVGAAAVLMVVLGFVIPGWQWLIFVGAVLFFPAVFSVRAWFVEGWIPTMFTNKGPGNNDSPPPPSGDWRT